MSKKIAKLRQDHKLDRTTCMGITASGKSRNLISLGKMIGKCKKTSLVLVLYLLSLGILTPAIGQRLLIKTADTIKIKTALRIVEQYEAEIYQTIITKTIIQFGFIESSPNVSFAITDELGGKKYYWIMLNPNLMDNQPINIIAAIILHEAMHNGYYMDIYKNIDAENRIEQLKYEHIHIYNYELKFLKKIGAPQSDITSRMNVMKSLAIPIL
jgi:hypothetical protein